MLRDLVFLGISHWLTLCFDRDIRVGIALETISTDPEGLILFIPLLFGETENNVELRIQWITRARNIEANDFQRQARPRQGPSMEIIAEPESDKSWSEIYRQARESEACAVCLSRAPDCALRPCGHARCCRQCVVETVCTWRQAGPPRCALCRAPFHTMVFLE